MWDAGTLGTSPRNVVIECPPSGVAMSTPELWQQCPGSPDRKYSKTCSTRLYNKIFSYLWINCHKFKHYCPIFDRKRELITQSCNFSGSQWNMSVHFLALRGKCKRTVKQDCIPVGCVPPAHWPYLPGCSMPGGCLLPGGSAPGGSCCSQGVYSGGVSALGGGVCSWGVSAPRGLSALGVSAPGGGIPACTEADTPPWAEPHTPVKT